MNTRLLLFSCCLFAATHLSARTYEAVSLSKIYQNSSYFEEGYDFHPKLMNSNGEIFGLLTRDSEELLALGKIEAGEFSFKIHPASFPLIPPFFMNKKGQVTGLQKDVVKSPFLWSPNNEENTFLEIPPFEKCKKNIHVKGIDQKGNVIVICQIIKRKKSGKEKREPLEIRVWSEDKYKRITAPFDTVKAVNPYGKIFGFSNDLKRDLIGDTNSPSSFKTYDAEFSTRSVVEFNQSKWALFAVAEEDWTDGNIKLYLWGRPALTIFGSRYTEITHEFIDTDLKQAHLNNNNDVIFSNGADHYLWRHKKSKSIKITNLISDFQSKISYLLDLNDQGEILLQSEEEYFLLRPK